MTKRQTWLTIGLDLKRAANFLAIGSEKQANYFLDEARRLLENEGGFPKEFKRVAKITDLEVVNKKPSLQAAEDLLLFGSLISQKASSLSS